MNSWTLYSLLATVTFISAVDPVSKITQTVNSETLDASGERIADVDVTSPTILSITNYDIAEAIYTSPDLNFIENFRSRGWQFIAFNEVANHFFSLNL